MEHAIARCRFASELVEVGRKICRGIQMSAFSNGRSKDGRRSRIGPRAREQAEKPVTHADLVLARYPAEEREQIVELLRILARKPGDAESVTAA